MAEKYRLNWSRDPVRRVLANVPTYMMWDDHDIRDGWGSLASDSPTLVAKHPRGAEIFRKSTAYFEDARDVYWHFQGCRNPLPGDIATGRFPRSPTRRFLTTSDGPIPHGPRRAMPFVFRCGRLMVLVLDSRGERDVFREDFRSSAQSNGRSSSRCSRNLPADVDALAVVTRRRSRRWTRTARRRS